MPQLIIEQPNQPPKTIPISDGEIRLGRAEDNDVFLANVENVSRYHARIIHKQDRTVITDLKSMNGTFVNRKRVHEAVLKHRDEIWLGSEQCRLIFRDDTTLGVSKKVLEQRSSEFVTSLENSIHAIRKEMEQVDKEITLIRRKTDFETPSARVSIGVSTDMQRMERAYRRLAALHKANQQVSSPFDLKTRLTDMLTTIMEVLEAKRGFVLLREENSKMLNVVVALHMGQEWNASSPSMGIAGRAAIDGQPVLMSNRSTNSEFGERESIIAKRIQSAMCVPFKTKSAILGSIYVDTDDPEVCFGEEDLELFSSLAAQAALAIENVRLHHHLVEAEKRRITLARFLPNALVEKIINESEKLTLGGTKTTVTTLFCDIRGSSKLAEQLDPQNLVTLLNEHFTAMTEILFSYQGTLDKYMGDEIMAVFGAPIKIGEEPWRAVCAALEMRHKNEELNVLRRMECRPELQLGIGIDSGEVIAGYIGSPKRMDFTVVGDRVNTAKRFCDMAEPGKIVIGEEIWKYVRDRVETKPMGTLMLKGKDQAVHAYEVVGFLKSSTT